jgi:hypothetical protein
MHPVNYGYARAFMPPNAEDAPTQEEDIELTRSYTESDSEDQAEDDIAPQQLARAIMTWDPALLSSLCAAGMMQPHASAFAGFLNRLNLTTGLQTPLRGEVLEWLRQLSTDRDKLPTVFRIAAAARGEEQALATYRAMRTASQ